MGCDIHLYVEKRVNGKWESTDTWEKDEYEKNRLTVSYNKRFYSGRNYDLFSILADVRNGHGFAGCDTGDGYKPIAKPKGLPKDVTKLVEAESEAWGLDGHSHSWFTLQEIFAYDWTQTTKKRFSLDALQFFNWRRWRRGEGKMPEGWCHGTSGRDIQYVTPQEMDRRLDALLAPNKGKLEPEELVKQAMANFHCWNELPIPYYKMVNEFLGQTVWQLMRLGKPKDVRIVFWFDN